MKQLLTFLFVLAIGSMLQAQWVVETFDNAVGPVYKDPPVLNVNFFASGKTPKMDLFNEPDHVEGVGSMKVDYNVEASEGWGGYTVRRTYSSGGEAAAAPDIDLSAGTYLKLRYKVITPADTTKEGSVFMELKPYEVDAAGSGELWNHHMQIDMFDASGTWKEVLIPLVEASDNNFGFNKQSGYNDGKLNFDKIKAFELTCVYIVPGNAATPPRASGVVLLDKLELLGSRYPKIFTFDNSASGWNLDWMDWAGADKGAIAVSDEAVDTVEGLGSLKVDYTLSAPFGWGGFVSIDKAVVTPDSLGNRTALVLYVKNLVPVVADSGRAFMRVILTENSAGENEDWVADGSIDFSQPFDWTRVYLPLVPKPMLVTNNDRFPPKNGFAPKTNNGDKIFNPEFLTKVRIEVFGRGTEDGFAAPLKATGTILLDVMQQSGFKFADKEAPAAPVVSAISASPYSNLVTWLDVPGESSETYNVYASANPITDVNADGVEMIGSSIVHGVQVVEHVLKSANIDRQKTFYYAVDCKDLAGNQGPAGTAGPATNTARGVPTVSINPPTAFVADGVLNEWSAAQPSFIMSSATGTANVVLTVDGDADCSAEVKVAIDNTYLYVMMDVTDDVVFWNDAIATYENDAPDMFIGLYNLTKSHVAYWRGTTADYHLRFGKFFIRNDQSESQCDSMIANKTVNYWYDEKFPSGYIIEARIPLVDLATKRNGNSSSTDVINWKAGDRIPFDIGINDNDGTTRQGMIFYSPSNGDQGWQNVSRWTYTWIGDEVTGVEDNETVVNSFNLQQNYPNPFNPSTKITYSIPEPGLVSIKVFDILGRQVAELVNKQQSAGSYTVDFNAQNLSAGVYLYKIESGSFQASKKMILMK
jgi:hypothetical protein